MDDTEKYVWKFLDEPVPGSSTDGPQKRCWDDWNQRCKDLPPIAAQVLLNALREKPSRLHYGAVLGLRHHGYEAWADGYGKETTYLVRKTGEPDWQRIVPADPPPDA